MEAKFRNFEKFPWGSDPKWQEYLSNLYPVPAADKMPRIKRKFYKQHIDKDFDIEWRPADERPTTGPAPQATSEPFG